MSSNLENGRLFPPDRPIELQELWNEHQDRVKSILEREGLIPPNGFEVHIPPRIHPSSQALYPVEYRIAERSALVLVQFLLPGSTSSTHFHPPRVTEEYRHIAGVLIVNNQQVLQPNCSRIILPKEVHRVHTNNTSALTLIVMRGVNGIPNDGLHIRLDPAEGDRLLGKFVQ